MLDANVLPPLLLTLKVSSLATALASIPAVTLARYGLHPGVSGPLTFIDAVLTLAHGVCRPRCWAIILL